MERKEMARFAERMVLVGPAKDGVRANSRGRSIRMGQDWPQVDQVQFGLKRGERVEAALRELEDLLPGANYIVDFQTIRVPFAPGWLPEQYITAAVGPKPPLTRVAQVALSEVVAEVEYYLRYDRDQYRHLEKPPHQTPRFAELVAVVRAELERLAQSSAVVFRFWRDDPIEWQFSYLFVGPGGAVVFIGWGSD